MLLEDGPLVVDEEVLFNAELRVAARQLLAPLQPSCSSSRRHRTHLEILRQFETQLGFGGDLFLSAGVDLGACSARSAYEGSDGGSFASTQQRSQNGSHCCAASDVFGGTLIGSESSWR